MIREFRQRGEVDGQVAADRLAHEFRVLRKPGVEGLCLGQEARVARVEGQRPENRINPLRVCHLVHEVVRCLFKVPACLIDPRS